MNTDCPMLADGTQAIPWIYNLFGTCIYGWQESISLLFGYLSILCWLNAQMPQVIKNYRRSDANGLSFGFLTVWLIGDIANFIGCIITNQLPFQLFLATYYTIIDTILCGQWLYYVKYNNSILRWFNESDETKPIYPTQRKEEPAEAITIDKEVNEQSSLLGSSAQTPRYATMLFVFGVVSFGLSPSDLFTSPDMSSDDVISMTMTENNTIWIGRLFAWICTFLYLSSRLPQIYQNACRRSVEGLSMALFFFAAMGNLTYVLSIIINPHATRASMLESVPYLIGSAGTLTFDGIIFVQYLLWSHKEDEINSLA
ncbi:PQ loop repeat-domain-containing protein [Pilobolus umbonatus]|nr:PQ loop repeat-domain-containing protein [Pilobolus umbonatus]